MGRTANQYVKLLILLIFFLCLAPEGAETQVPGDPPAISANRYVGGFTSPVHITHAGNGSGRLFVVEQPGHILMSDALGVMPLPTGTRAFSYPAETLPTVSIDPALAKPIATGLDASGSPALNLRIALPQLGGSADVYCGVYAPYIDASQLYLLTTDNRLAPLSSGVVRWKEKTTGPMDELPFGTIPISALQSGPYYLYLLVTPAGDLSNYYLWTTSFSVP